VAGRDEIIAFCDELLESKDFEDYGPNGLQVPGAAQAGKVASGVSAQRELIERAAAAGAGLLIVHHGLFWNGQPRSLSPHLADRLRAAFEADLSIAAYHLPLDAHREIGNNALLCGELGLDLDERPFAMHRGKPIGVIGACREGLAADELFARVRESLGREPLVFASGPEEVRAVGIVSGAGTSALGEAIELGLDVFLTGEPAELAMAEARDAGIHFIAAGHYATETLGIRALGERIAGEFDVEHEFIDIPNPI
jgi:dinuclear metal center YbgI/SA1388 family protein